MMKFVLPMPPGINATYGIGRVGLFKKVNVKDWEREAGWEIKQQLNKQTTVKKRKREPYAGNVRVDVIWYCRQNRDIDAGIKVLLDRFEDMRIYKNDIQVTELNMTKLFDAKNPRVEVEINYLI